MKELTLKEEGFCQSYLLLQEKAAAYRENYSCDKMKPETVNRKAVELADKPHVKARIAELMEERCERTQIKADYVLQRLVDYDQLDIADILNADGSVKPILEWPKVWRISVNGIDVSELFDGRGDERDVMGILKKIKWPDKIKILELIGKHVSVQAFKEKVDVEVGAKQSLQDLLKQAAADD